MKQIHYNNKSSIPLEFKELIPKYPNVITPIIIEYIKTTIHYDNVLIEISISKYNNIDEIYGITFLSKDDKYKKLSKLYKGNNYLKEIDNIIKQLN